MFIAVYAGMLLLDQKWSRAAELDYLWRMYHAEGQNHESGTWPNFAVMDSLGVIHQVSEGADSWHVLQKVPGSKYTYYMPDGTIGAIPGDAGP